MAFWFSSDKLERSSSPGHHFLSAPEKFLVIWTLNTDWNCFLTTIVWLWCFQAGAVPCSSSGRFEGARVFVSIRLLKVANCRNLTKEIRKFRLLIYIDLQTLSNNWQRSNFATMDIVFIWLYDRVSLSPEWLQITESVLWFLAITGVLPFLNNPKDLDPSYEMDLDL